MRFARGLLFRGCLLAAAGLGLVRVVRGAPLDYALPPPPVNVAELGLPAIDVTAQATNTLDLTSIRGIRDEAIRAFHQQRYDECLRLLDRMAETVPLTPNLSRLQAWAATYAGLDERAAELWTTLANASAPRLLTQEMAGWHAFRLDRMAEATSRYTTCLRLQPQENRLVHMAGLAAWREGRLPAAQRLLVQALQMKPSRPETLVAMAALQAESQHYPVAAGWLRRALPDLAPDARRHWLTRPEFLTMAENWGDGWRTLVQEFAPDLLEEAPPPTARDDTPLQPVSSGTKPREGLAILRLTLFAGDPNTRMDRIRAYQTGQLLKRLLAEEQLSETMSLGEYETISTVR